MECLYEYNFACGHIWISAWIDWSQNFSICVVVTISFEQAEYRIKENKEYIQLSLVFDNPSSADINAAVVAEDGSAIGE